MNATQAAQDALEAYFETEDCHCSTCIVMVVLTAYFEADDRTDG